jgi:hypothetical protein
MDFIWVFGTAIQKTQVQMLLTVFQRKQGGLGLILSKHWIYYQPGNSHLSWTRCRVANM